MCSAVMVFLQEIVVAFREVARGGENRVEFGGDDFLNFAIGRFGLGAEGMTKANCLFMGSWI